MPKKDIYPLRCWRFHPEKGQKLMTVESQEDMDDLEEAGWVDTPAKFEESEIDSGELNEEAESLLVKFNEDPKSLTKDEHVLLGKALGVHPIQSRWAEETLINKIQEKLDNGND